MAKSQTVLPVFFHFNNYKEQLPALGRGKALMSLGYEILSFRQKRNRGRWLKGWSENAS
jgi:hypothetical protein